MKIRLAVYTAQEGYSWQPGSAITLEEISAYKMRIGKFPSPDSLDEFTGGVFSTDTKVVFYRCHLAKRIDFRGRDALYVVIGDVAKEDAKSIDPITLFSLPEFAGPMRPFPTCADVQTAEDGCVPTWLKNLDQMTLDVKMSGVTGNVNFSVKQESLHRPEPQPIEKPIRVSPSTSSQQEGACGQKPLQDVPEGDSLSDIIYKYRQTIQLVIRITAIIAIAVIAALLAILVRDMRKQQPGTEKSVVVPKSVETIDVSSVRKVSVSESSTNSVSVQSSTNGAYSAETDTNKVKKTENTVEK